MQPIITMRNVSKAFGHVRALIDVSLDIYPGETLGLKAPHDRGAHEPAMAGHEHARVGAQIDHVPVILAHSSGAGPRTRRRPRGAGRRRGWC